VDNAEDIIEALLTPPRHEPGEVSEEWVEYKTWSLNGVEQQAALYLGHIQAMPGISKSPPGNNWRITPTLQRAVEHNPELIVASARMKKLMLED